MNDGLQVRVGGLQRAVVAGAGRRHARPAVVPAAARAGAHAAVPRRRRHRLAANCCALPEPTDIAATHTKCSAAFIFSEVLVFQVISDILQQVRAPSSFGYHIL